MDHPAPPHHGYWLGRYLGCFEQSARARRSIVLGRSVDPRGGFGLPWPAFRPTRAALASSAKKNPRQFPAGGSFRDVVRRLGLPDALSAEHDGPGVLVAKGVGASRLTSGVGWQYNGARVLLIKHRIDGFRSERQVLDRSPAEVRTNLPDVVI